MGKYFVPSLDPSQVWVPSEYLVAHGQQITFAIKESVIEADRTLELGERVRFAMPATFSIEGESHSGIAVVTTHRFFCCSSVGHNLINASMPFSHSIDIGNGTGLILKQMPVCCDSISVLVKSSGEHIKTLRTELLDAIEAAPNQSPIDFRGPTLFRRSAAEHRRIQRIKDAHRGERRLSKAESATYGPCPDCKGTFLIERHGKIYCMKCGHQLQGAKK